MSAVEGTVGFQERVLAELAELRSAHERVQAERQSLQEMVERLQETVEGGVSRIQDRQGPAVREPAPAGIEDVANVTRRGLLHRLGTAAAAGAGLAAAGSLVAAGPAEASHQPGFGHSNFVGDWGTEVRGTSVGPLLTVSNGKAAGIHGSSREQPGLIGVSALSNGIGATVTGESWSSDGNGNALWAHTAGSGNAILAEQQSTGSSAAGVLGISLGFGNAVVGEQRNVNNDSAGVLGISHGKGNSVFGFKPEGAPGDGVVGLARSGRGVHALSDTGIALEVGGSARMLQQFRATAGAPTTGSFFAGEQIRDANGELWLCIAPGSPGTWRRAALVRNGFAGGSVNFLAKPIRIFDSRSGAPLANGTARDVQVTGVVVGGVSVPAGAVGVIGNVTVTQTVAPNGYLTLYPQGSPPSPATANINWFAASQNLNTSAIVALNAANGRLTIHNGMAGGSNATHVVFDVAAFVV
jgi:hypothetical protein